MARVHLTFPFLRLCTFQSLLNSGACDSVANYLFVFVNCTRKFECCIINSLTNKNNNSLIDNLKFLQQIDKYVGGNRYQKVELRKITKNKKERKTKEK